MSISSLSKDEISAKLNEVLGLKDKPIDFTKLTKDEMIRLYEAIESLSAGGALLGSKILNRPVVEVLNMRLKDVIKEISEGRGLLGLGVLRTIVDKLEKL